MFFTDYLYPLFSSLDENLSPGRILRYGKLFLFMCFLPNVTPTQYAWQHVPWPHGHYTRVARTCKNPTPSDPSGTECSLPPTPFKYWTPIDPYTPPQFIGLHYISGFFMQPGYSLMSSPSSAPSSSLSNLITSQSSLISPDSTPSSLFLKAVSHLPDDE